MMIKRRIQLTGKSTFTISLPREWIDRFHINQGDELIILEQSDGTLLISKSNLLPNREKKIVVEIDKIDDSNLLEKIIISKYLSGFTKVILTSKKEISPKFRKSITTTVNNLIGSEIISEGINEVEIRDLTIHGEFPIEKAIRRAHLIAYNMQIMAIDSLIKGDIESAKDIFERESSVDRLYFLIRREILSALENPAILKELDIKPQEVLYIYPVAKSLEKIADHCESIAQSCIELNGRKLNEETCKYFSDYSHEAMEIHTQAIQGFLGKKIDLAFNAIQIFKRLHEKLVSKTLSRNKSTDLEIEIQVQLVERNLDRICGYGLDIAEMAIDRIQ